MSLLDVVLVVVAVLAGVGGYRLGFFTRVLSWVGLAAGVYVAARFLPDIVAATRLSTASARLVVAAIVLVGAAFVGQAAGMVLGGHLHRFLPRGPLRSVDKLIGAGVGVLGVGVALWLLLPAISSVAGWPARATRQSVISRWVANDLPPPPDPLQSLRRLVGTGAFPEVFDALHPDASAGVPPSANPLSAAVTARVETSTVQVLGQACDRLQAGSGFTVAPGLVVTNAHVVAGEPAGDTYVLTPSGRRLAARVVLYDPNRDLALLSVAGLDQTALALAPGQVGLHGSVFGHPGGQRALAIQPATVAQEVTAVGEDLYDRHHTSRDVYVLAASLAPGDSGGALVDQRGQVVGVAFAIALDRSDTAYALTSAEVEQVLAEHPSGHAVSTEACLAG